MLRSIVHVGVAVRDIETSIELFTALFGHGPDHREDVPDQRVRTAMFAAGPSSVELLQATSPDSAIAKFIEKRGEGMHHISFVVDDIHVELHRLEAAGFQLIDREPRRGAGGYLVAFVHPKSTNGVLIELGQKIEARHGS